MTAPFCELSRSDAEVGELTELLRQLRSVHDVQASQLEASASSKGDLERRVEELRARAEGAEARAQAAETSLASALREGSSLRERGQALEGEVQALREVVAELDRAIENARRGPVGASEERAAGSPRREAAGEEARALRERLREAELSRARLEEANGMYRKREAQLKDAVRRLEEELEVGGVVDGCRSPGSCRAAPSEQTLSSPCR